ncbi:MAG: hypothetical protein ACK562_08410 [Acidobacteriota bacterium]
MQHFIEIFSSLGATGRRAWPEEAVVVAGQLGLAGLRGGSRSSGERLSGAGADQ